MASENKKDGGTFVGLALIPILFIPTLLINLFFPVALQPLQPLLCMDASAHLYSVKRADFTEVVDDNRTIASNKAGHGLHDLYVMGFMAVFLIIIWLILMALVKRRMQIPDEFGLAGLSIPQSWSTTTRACGTRNPRAGRSRRGRMERLPRCNLTAQVAGRETRRFRQHKTRKPRLAVARFSHRFFALPRVF